MAILRTHADFRRLWIGDGISKVGGSIAVLAIPVLAATTLDATTWQVALLTTFSSLPFLLIGLPIGAWADRVRRRPVLIAADLARAAVLAWVPVGAVLGVLTVEQLYAVELLVGIGTVLFDVSQGAYLPVLVGRGWLVEANGALQANHTLAYTAGPTVAGQLVGWLGAPLAVLATVAGFVWSALWIGSVRTREPRPPVDADRHLLREIRDGLRFVWHQPFLRATTLHATTAVLFLSTRYAVEVLFLLDTVGLSAGGIGLLATVAGLGSVAGAVLARRVAGVLGRIRTVLVSSLGVGLSSLLVPLTTGGAGLVWFAAGAGLVAFWITVNNVVAVSVRQLLCPDHLLGRMNATGRFLGWATLPLGGVAGGALGTALGLRTTLWLAAAGLLVAPLWLVLSPACRARDLPQHRELARS
jgi:predicted MFS family arabinose efflux permease